MKDNKLRREKAAEEAEDMELIKVRKNFQLTIPQALRERLGLSEGDYLEAEVENGNIVIRPVQVVRSKAKRKESSRDRQRAYAALDEIWAKTKDEDPEEAQKLVSKSVKAVRKS